MGKKKASAGRRTEFPPAAEIQTEEETPRVPGEAAAEMRQAEEMRGRLRRLFSNTHDRRLDSAVHRAARADTGAAVETGRPMSQFPRGSNHEC